MFRKYVIVTLAIFAFVATNGCTSKKAQDENAEEISSDESLESADATENNGDLATDDAGVDMGDELAADEKLPDDKADGKVAENGDVSADDLKETPPAGDTPPAEEMAATDTPPADPAAEAPPADTSTEMAATDTPTEESTPTPEPAYGEQPKANMSLKKIAASPYREGKVLVNAVYIARKGDSVEAISQKLFASKGHVKELCKINAHNCSRDVKVGDKFYYNSPQRPDDETAMKTFYEDAGIAPQTYTAKSGDNIRTVGQQLLGDSRSWMELWATNPVESKSDLEEGTQLRYWPTSDAVAPTQTMAQTEEAAPPPPDTAMNEPPPPADIPPPPPEQEVAMAPPPPPPPEEMAPPAAAAGTIEPPPPPPPPPPAEIADSHDGAASPDQTMVMGGVVVLLAAAAALFISIRKKRARRQIDFNATTQTQIDT